MNIRFVPMAFIVFLAFSLVVQAPVFAEESPKDSLKESLKEDYRQKKDICPVVKNAIQAGKNTKEVTKACIELGHDACLVVRCAVEAKGDLEQIITGAIEAGATSDVCSRCAMTAGADPKEIAKILESGLGYSPGEGGGLTPVDISLPGGNTGGQPLSNSGF